MPDNDGPTLMPKPSTVAGEADDRMRFWLGISVILMVSSFFGATFIEYPKLPGETLGLIIGGMISWMGMVLGYFFGSSSGSKVKTMQQREEGSR